MTENKLAERIDLLFGGQDSVDMIAVVHEDDDDEHSDGDEDKRSNVYEIKCHRVILAARCPYFKRALLSGMKEDIERYRNILNKNMCQQK